MSSPAINTVIRMMESLPETTQNHIVDHLRQYLADLQDEMQWDKKFEKTESQLRIAAQKARQEITEGQATPLDFDQL